MSNRIEQYRKQREDLTRSGIVGQQDRPVILPTFCSVVDTNPYSTHLIFLQAAATQGYPLRLVPHPNRKDRYIAMTNSPDTSEKLGDMFVGSRHHLYSEIISAIEKENSWFLRELLTMHDEVIQERAPAVVHNMDVYRWLQSSQEFLARCFVRAELIRREESVGGEFQSYIERRNMAETALLEKLQREGIEPITADELVILAAEMIRQMEANPDSYLAEF